MTSPFSIAGRPIGPAHPPYVIAEMSGNHNGSLERALEIVAAAKKAGADAVKLQTYTADTMTIDHHGPGFTINGGLWSGRTLHSLYREAYTPWEWHAALFARGRELGITVFSSPFDATAVDLLQRLEAPAFKIASFELVDLPLIQRVARTGKPMIMSTGMATLGEIEEAVEAAQEAGAVGVALLHCTSAYPTPPEESHLRTIPHLADAFGLPTGLSDHTAGAATAVAAVSLGASIIEKHVTLRRADGGPDAAFSLEPEELARLCADVREAWLALGGVSYRLTSGERPMRTYRRSLYITKDVRAGSELTGENLRSIRPGFGLPPKHIGQLLGRRARQDIAAGTPATWDLVDAGDAPPPAHEHKRGSR